MKKLHKKIVASAFVGMVAIGGVLSQASIGYASSSSVKVSISKLSPEEEKFAYPYMKLISRYFGFGIHYYQKSSNKISVKEHFPNPGIFAQSLLENGMDSGVYFFNIGGYDCLLSFNNKIYGVSMFGKWPNNLPRFYDYIDSQK